MILRMWAMYNQSRLIFCTLFTFLSIEIVSAVVAAAAYIDSKNYRYFTIQLLEYSSCYEKNTAIIWVEVTLILQVIFAAVLCMLAIIQFVKQSISMYNLTKQWQLNRYINLLVKEGIVYFIMYVPVHFRSSPMSTG
ncbi:hypothetical protein JVU11DRAFT_5697 [Chiua virens]|nr:hypothetical protein JVU11DRAFT_5697 [Chiua virens]